MKHVNKNTMLQYPNLCSGYSWIIGTVYTISSKIITPVDNFKYNGSYQYHFNSQINKIPQTIYIKTSASSYSASNMFAAYLQSNDLATIIGDSSSGGSSYIDSIYAPGGIVIFAPTLYHNSDEYGSYYEYGVLVDYIVSITDEDSTITLIEELR